MCLSSPPSDDLFACQDISFSFLIFLLPMQLLNPREWIESHERRYTDRQRERKIRLSFSSHKTVFLFSLFPLIHSFSWGSSPVQIFLSLFFSLILRSVLILIFPFFFSPSFSPSGTCIQSRAPVVIKWRNGVTMQQKEQKETPCVWMSSHFP